MAEQTKHIAIDAPDGPTILAARHLDAIEGPVQVGATVTTATRSAIDQVLRYIAKAHNSPATAERQPAAEYADIKFTRHQGQAITIDGPAPARTRIAIQALMDRYAYLHMPTPDTVVFADQVVYRITGYADGALELEFVEDWRPAPTVQRPPTAEEYEALKAKWQQTHGNGQVVTLVEVPKDGPADG